MDRQTYPQAPSDEISNSQNLSGSDEGDNAWIYFDQNNSKEPSIPLLIALILGVMLLGVLLATHWPFRKF